MTRPSSSPPIAARPKMSLQPSRGAYRNRTGGGPASVPRAKDSPLRRAFPRAWRRRQRRIAAARQTAAGRALTGRVSCPRATVWLRAPTTPRAAATAAGASLPRSSSCRRRRCPGYAPIWAGDQRQKLFGNLNAYADQVPSGIKSPRVLVSAATAPGVGGGMHWDEHRCKHLGPHTHSGKLGCRVRSSIAVRWNESAADRWRRLHRRAYQQCVKEGLEPWLLVRVWEIQKRGLLHAHPVLAYSTPREKASADRYLRSWMRCGFNMASATSSASTGCASREPLPPIFSSYFIAGKGSKISLEESVQSNWMPRSIVHVSKELTQLSGVTMRTLRLRRYAWVVWRNVDPSLWALSGGLTAYDLWCAFKQDVTLTELMASGLCARGVEILEA